MSDSLILESLNRNNLIIDNVTKRLESLQVLFSEIPLDKIVAKKDGFVCGGVESFTIYQSDDVSVTMGTWKKAGDLWPNHCHDGSVEFLIVTRGKFIVSIDLTPRIMGQGECASIPCGKRHSVKSLEKNSQMIGICVPPEKAYLVEVPTCLKLTGKN